MPCPAETRPVAEGVELYRPQAGALLEPPGPIVVQALRLDPALVDLALVLANDATPARLPVTSIAARHGALAAVNASFSDPIGRQVGLLKTHGDVVAVATTPRGAVGWARTGEGLRVVFDCVRSTIGIRAGNASEVVALAT